MNSGQGIQGGLRNTEPGRIDGRRDILLRIAAVMDSRPSPYHFSMTLTPDMTVVGGRAVRYLETGSPAGADTLLLLHAFPMGVRLWEPQLDAFSGWRVIAPALPGFDGSDLLEDPFVGGYAGQVVGVLDNLGLEEVAVAGLSMGGYVAFELLRQVPHRIRGLVLADTRSTADALAAKQAREHLLTVADQQGPGAIANETLPRLLGATTHRERPDLVAAVRSMIEFQSPEGIAAAIRLMMTRPDSTPTLASIKVPTLVIVGAEDQLTPPEEASQMSESIHGAELLVIEGAGHLTNIEKPGAFNEALARWLTKM
jgi:3-oxoadipate enol-lactonase